MKNGGTMHNKVVFDNDTKVADISTHGCYTLHRAVVQRDGTTFAGEHIQDGLSDELGLIYLPLFDDIVTDPSDLPKEEIERRLLAVCDKPLELRRDIMQQERCVHAQKYLVAEHDVAVRFVAGQASWGEVLDRLEELHEQDACRDEGGGTGRTVGQ